MVLKVLGAGFGRTGTHSLKIALEQLGYGPCHHMYEVRQRPEQVEWWLSAARGETLNWDKVFEGFVSQVDWPASYFWKELSTYYPEAKVILTDRDPESWYKSISRTILPASEIGRYEDPDPTNRKASEMIYQIALKNIFEGRLGEKDFAIATMQAHREEVIDTISPERLLVFDIAEGWEPLCAFLNVECPTEPFPQTNSAKEFRARKPYLANRSGGS
ncbi:MAG: sulfotransferase family protein [Rhodobacteraceae bacterium]|nr:sulfotransferase family protein [Paracoccaceae bacterium]